MNDERFKELVKSFFKAIKEKTLLIIIDTSSKGYTARFSLVSFKKKNSYNYGYEEYSGMLKEIGFKKYGKYDEVFVTECAGRFSLYILSNIGDALRQHGVRLPKDYYNLINYQNCI